MFSSFSWLLHIVAHVLHEVFQPPALLHNVARILLFYELFGKCFSSWFFKPLVDCFELLLDFFHVWLVSLNFYISFFYSFMITNLVSGSGLWMLAKLGNWNTPQKE